MITNILNGAPTTDGGAIAESLVEMALVTPAATQAQENSLTTLQNAWSAYTTALATAKQQFQGQ
jgi:hypothetical protein